MATSTYVAYYTVIVSKSRKFESYISGYDTSVTPPVAIWQNDVVIPLTYFSGDATSYTATDLEPGTAYYFLLSACNNSGCRSIILGPYMTDAVMDSAEGLRGVYYRQDPITGLTRIWWEQTVVPDKTVLVLQPIDGYGETLTFTEYGKQYTIKPLVAGTYTTTIQNFIDNDGSNVLTFTMYIHDYCLCDLDDAACFADDVSSVAYSIQMDFTEILDIWDMPQLSLLDVAYGVIDDAVFLDDTVVYAGSGSVECDFEEIIIVDDSWYTASSESVQLAVDSRLFVADSCVLTAPLRVYAEFEDSPVLFDSLYLRHLCVSAEPVEAIKLKEGEVLSDSPCYCVNEPGLLIDKTEFPVVSVRGVAEPLFLWDSPVVPELNDNTENESLFVFDLADESEVGHIYDFSHVNGGAE